MRPHGFMYYAHGVIDRPVVPYFEASHLELRTLDAAVQYFGARGYRFVSMEEVVSMATRGFPRGRPWIHLSFDDGFQSMLTTLLPWSQERGVPISVFVTKSNIEDRARFSPFLVKAALFRTPLAFALPGTSLAFAADAPETTRMPIARQAVQAIIGMNRRDALGAESYLRSLLTEREWEDVHAEFPLDQPLTEDELQRLAAAPNVYVGSHCVHHVALGERLSDDTIREELTTSRDWLRSELGADGDVLAYPYGQPAQVSQRATELARECGYRLAVTTVDGVVDSDTDPFRVPRVMVLPSHRRLFRRLTIPGPIFDGLTWANRTLRGKSPSRPIATTQ